jgi:hypothetical protein
MPETLSDAFEAPIPATAGGKSFDLPLLDVDDLSFLGRQIYAQAMQVRLRKLPLTASQTERDNIIRYYEDMEADVDTLSKWVFTLPGTFAFIRRSFSKLKISGPEADAWTKRHARENGWQSGTCILAAKLSGLFPPERKEAQKGNPPAGAAGDSTGSSADASSNESAGNPPAE